MTSYDLGVVEEDVADLKRRGVKAVFVSDESFTTRPQLKEVAGIYGKGDFEVLYSSGTATTLTEEKMRFLADNGWHSLNLGLEEINTAYRKNKDPGKAIGLGKRFGIQINLSFIVNDYGKSLNESLRDYHALFNAFCDYKPGMVAANFMMPFPGTGIWEEYKGRITEDDYVKYDSKTPIFAKEKLADWHKHMAVAVQLAYYHSDTYAEVRNFHNGDNLNLRFRELEVQFNMQNEGWRKWFDPENPTTTLIPEGLDPNKKENEMADLSASMKPQMRRGLPVIQT